ncbi:MAG: DUF1573 domain-containing protein [Pirellulaceae bacterium]|nr:DUF1573 domain-containing protein [Pirellulaceae bacterium]
MKFWIFLSCVAGIGIAAGVGINWMELSRLEESLGDLTLSQIKDRADDTLVISGPRLEALDGLEYDFGTMELNGTRTHSFRFKNVGSKVLTLHPEKATCKCTRFEIDTEKVQPGEIATVFLEWKGVPMIAGEPRFRQEAPLSTNDPGFPELRLAVSGLIEQNYRAHPSEASFNSLTVNFGKELRFRIYDYKSPDFEILEIAFENEQTVDFFEVSHQPLPAEIVAQEFGAKSGKVVLLKLKPGLPVGAIHQTINFQTNGDDGAIVSVPVSGTIKYDISLAGSDKYFTPGSNVVKFGRISHGVGASAKLNVIIKGNKRETTDISVGEIEPEDTIEVKVGEKKEVGNVVLFPVVINILEDAEPQDRSGSQQSKPATVMLNTTDENAKQIQILVRYFVDSKGGAILTN